MSLNLFTTSDRNFPMLQASKWLQIQVLLEVKELEELLAELKEFYLFRNGVILEPIELEIFPSTLLNDYDFYIQSLKNQNMPNLADLKKKFTLILSHQKEAVFAFKISEKEQILKAKDPIIQIQSHSMHYSQDDNKFRPMVFGSDSITWGLQFSFPQLYLDPESLEIKNALIDSNTNSKLFKTLQKWVRINTLPTTFETPLGQTNTSLRLGKKCLNWIHLHPQLINKGIKVKR